ncbi:MAG TPA: C39 family peptidase [Candidatus Omnitrophota bacterium]|nr:C39 family peptidase [Candidatus Omnitrophota bacterium]
MEFLKNLNSIASTAISKVDTAVKTATVNPTYTGTSFLSSLAAIAQKQLQPVTVPIISGSLPNITPISLAVDKKISVPNLIQGHNECGPTSLSMVERYYGIYQDQHTMFESSTVGHGPIALEEKAEAKNLTVRQINNGTVNDLVALIDKGIPAMVLGINGGGSNSTIADYISNASRGHWMVVTGYKKDDAGNVTNIYFNNPNYSTTQCWTVSDFESKFWDNNLVPTGHRYIMAMAPKGSFSESLLKAYLPSDRTSDTFKTYLSIIDGLEDAFYTAEEVANEVADAAGDVWDTVSGWFS